MSGQCVITRQDDGSVTVETADDYVFVSLELLVNGDPAVMSVNGLDLTFCGTVTYRVVGINERCAALLCQKIADERLGGTP